MLWLGAIRGTEAFLIVPSKLAKETFGMLLSFLLFIFIFHNLFNEYFMCYKNLLMGFPNSKHKNN